MKVVIRGLCVQTTYGVKRQLEKDVLDHEARLQDLEKCILMQLQRMEAWQQARRVLLEDWRRLERYVYEVYRQHLHAEDNKVDFTEWAVAEEVLMKHVRTDDKIAEDVEACVPMLQDLGGPDTHPNTLSDE
ncbi:hypothetical protein NDU88_005929 [Pleurodeles waltl]|uniref:Uncharacterized protein n=1 Tax=Pleurodeles waltl TaxID=8319 RepID=A0AAV7SN14_PLEWA|nr:hypothetical protein NDU88_005929 [Pleurodeles waltl]